MIFTAVDVETTGTDPAADSLVEIGAIDIIDGTLSEKPRSSLIFPGRDIPPQSKAVHHIVEVDVEHSPRARDAVPQILQQDREGVVFVAHNASFECNFLKPYTDGPWLCTYRAALRVYPEAPAHNLQTLRYWLNLPVDRAIADQSHRALPDAIVCAYLLLDLIGKANVEDMIRWSGEPPLLPTCPIGEWRGKPWHDVEYNYLSWMVSKPIDNPDYVWNARFELDRRARAQEAQREAQNATKREAYVSLAIACINLGTSYPDLLKWFKDEEPNRAKWGIKKGDENFTKILNACIARKTDLEKQSVRAAA